MHTVRSSKATRLETFRVANGVKSAHLYLAARISRSYLARVRSGKIEPTRPKMLAIRDACSRLLGRQVHLSEVFDLGLPLPIVTSEHGDTFARAWYEHSMDALTMIEAFGDTNLVTWPEEADAKAEYQNIEDEICKRVFDAARHAISDAFVRVANDVFARERSR